MKKLLVATTLAMILHGITGALAQGPNLHGKSVQLIIGSGVGGGFDLLGRTVARHIGKHIPGKPTVVPQNMPGAGSLLAANYIYNAAPKDGTALAIIAPSAPMGPITGATGARFDATRFTWLGTPTMETPACIAFNGPRAKVKTANDLYENELVVGSTGAGNGTYIWPKALSALLGMKFKVVTGFQSSSHVLLAMERGEIDGMCSVLDTVYNQRPTWTAGKQIVILFQGGVESHPALKDVPLIVDMARNADDRAAIEFVYAGSGFGRPFVAPPGLPIGRAKMLQDAFSATMEDADFRADAKKHKLDVEPKTGEFLAALVRKIYATPKPIVDKVTALIK